MESRYIDYIINTVYCYWMNNGKDKNYKSDIPYEDLSLKKYIGKEISKAKSENADIADLTRQWLSRQNFLDVVIRAINGETVSGEKLKLKDRVQFAIKLSNKIIPDLKSIEKTETVSGTVNIKYGATQKLLDDIYCDDDSEVLDVKDLNKDENQEKEE